MSPVSEIVFIRPNVYGRRYWKVITSGVNYLPHRWEELNEKQKTNTNDEYINKIFCLAEFHTGCIETLYACLSLK